MAAEGMQDRMPPIPADKMTDAQKEAAAEILAGPRKAVVGPFIPLMRSPELMNRLQKVGEYLRYNTKLGSNISEFIILQMARHMTQQFEWDSHVDLARKAGVKEATITAIAEGRHPSGMTRGRGDGLRVRLRNPAAPERVRCHVRAGGEAIWRARCDRYHGFVRVLHHAGLYHERSEDSAAPGENAGAGSFSALIQSGIDSGFQSPLRISRTLNSCSPADHRNDHHSARHRVPGARLSRALMFCPRSAKTTPLKRRLQPTASPLSHLGKKAGKCNDPAEIK